MRNLLKGKAAPQDADYTVVSLTSDGKIVVTAAVITIIFKDYNGTVISTEKYKYGEVVKLPSNPQRVDYDFIGWGDVQIDKAVANMTFIAQYEVTPKVTITMDDTYTDASSIALNATKTETVTGELSFTTDLASGIAHIEENALIFDKHYEGTINITAIALDKHGNEKSDSKTITVSCDVADTVEHEITNVTADDVEADATSAIIKYDCNVTTTTHAGVSNTVVTHRVKTVTFEVNESEEDVTRTGSFKCEDGETVEWSVVQKGYKMPFPSDNQIWYKTNDGVVIVPSNMSPTTNEYTTKGVMTFNDNVTFISKSAFRYKSSLTEFYGGMSLTFVGSYAFANCSSLTSVNLPKCTSVQYGAFEYCSSLTSVNLPECTNVGNDAFSHCTSLTSIDLPSCTFVDTHAFEYCTSLTSVNLPNCKTASNYAFANCSSLTSIDLPYCTYVGSYTFASCSSLTSVNLPSCGTVSSYAFTNCTSLTSIDLPKCTNVGNDAFASCTSLTSVNLPKCSRVNYNAFEYCSSLTSVNLLYCEGVNDSAFEYCTSLTSVNLPYCTFVGSYAFANCSSLTSVNLPKCKNVSFCTFASCSSLTSVNLPSCGTVSSYAFTNCTSLTTVTLGASSMCILVNSNAFSNCTSLTSIYVTASLVDTYKANSVWSWFTDKIVAIA